MKKIKFFSGILLLNLTLFQYFCSNELSSPYSIEYDGEYDLTLQIEDTTSFYAFIPARVSFTQKELYTSFSVETVPAGLIDTVHFRIFSSEEFSFYFKKPFSGELVVSAFRPNGICDTFNFPVRIQPPLFINCRKEILGFDSLNCSFDTEENLSSTVRKLILYFDSDSVAECTPSEETVNVYPPDKTTFTLSVVCVDYKGNESVADSIVISRLGPEPRINKITGPLFTIQHRPVEITAEVSSVPFDSAVVELYFDQDTVMRSVVFGSDSVVSVPLLYSKGISSLGTAVVTARVRSAKYECLSAPFRYYLPVNSSIYRVFFKDVPARFTVSDTLKWSARAFRVDSSVVDNGDFFWTAVHNSDTIVDTSISQSTLCLKLDTPGELAVSLLFRGDDGISSQRLSRTYTIGDLSVASSRIITIPSRVYTGVPVTFILPVSGEINSGTSTWTIDGESEMISEVQATKTIVRFDEPGNHRIQAVYKNDSCESTYLCTLDVHRGNPVVDSIRVDDTVYIHSEVRSAIFHCSNPLGSVLDSFCLILTNQDDSLMFVSGSPEVLLPSDTGYAGMWGLRGCVRNSNGLWSDPFSAGSLMVSKGFPEILSINPDTAILQSQIQFRVDAYDPDGEISQIIMNWGDGYEDTLRTNQSSLSVYLCHTYEITNESFFQITARAVDDRGYESETFKKKIIIHDGKPWVMPISRTFVYLEDTLRTSVNRDTLFTPFLKRKSDGAENIMVTMEGKDKDGQVLEYSISNLFLDTVWNSGKNCWLFPDWWSSHPFHIHPDSSAVRVAVFCRDNDGYVGSDSFYIKSDAPPGTISVLYPEDADTLSSSGFSLKWEGGYDSNDSLLTLTLKLYHNYESGEYKDMVLLSSIDEFNIEPFSQTSVDVSIPESVRNGKVKLIIEVKDSLWNRTKAERTFELLIP